MNIIFAGTPEFAAESLSAIIEAGHQIAAVYTQPDRPAGRGKKIMQSPVKQTALKHSIDVMQPSTLKDKDAQQTLIDLQPDVMIVAAYGLILPEEVLSIPSYGCINIHASLLPRWRGAAPIQRAIQAGDTETGITIMQMDVGLDTGDMLIKKSCPINEDTTGGSLHDKLAKLGAECILEYLANRTELSGEKQDESHATYAHKLSKAEAEIDWSQTAREVDRTVRAFNPWPVSFTKQGEERIRVFSGKPVNAESTASPGRVLAHSKSAITVACGEGAYELNTIQLAGSKAMSISDFLNGGKALLSIGTPLG